MFICRKRFKPLELINPLILIQTDEGEDIVFITSMENFRSFFVNHKLTNEEKFYRCEIGLNSELIIGEAKYKIIRILTTFSNMSVIDAIKDDIKIPDFNKSAGNNLQFTFIVKLITEEARF